MTYHYGLIFKNCFKIFIIFNMTLKNKWEIYNEVLSNLGLTITNV